MREVVIINFKNINCRKISLIYNQSYLKLVEWISAKSVAIGTAVPNKPVASLNVLTTGMPSKPVDLLISTAPHAAGHYAPHSASIAPLVMEEKLWKTLPKVSSIASLPVLSTVSDVVTVVTTASKSQVKFGVIIN